MKHEIPNDETLWLDLFFGDVDGYDFPVESEFIDKLRWSSYCQTIAHHIESDTYWSICGTRADEGSNDDNTADEPTQVKRVETTQVVISWEPVA